MTGLRQLAAATAVTVVLATGVGAATPALAQLSFGFGFNFDHGDHHFVFPRLCILTDRGLRNAIEDQGYEDVYLNAPIGRYVQARAREGSWIYLLRVNVCTGEITERERLRRAR
jgi:hypothetical protein